MRPRMMLHHFLLIILSLHFSSTCGVYLSFSCCFIFSSCIFISVSFIISKWKDKYITMMLYLIRCLCLILFFFEYYIPYQLNKLSLCNPLDDDNHIIVCSLQTFFNECLLLFIHEHTYYHPEVFKTHYGMCYNFIYKLSFCGINNKYITAVWWQDSNLYNVCLPYPTIKIDSNNQQITHVLQTTIQL